MNTEINNENVMGAIGEFIEFLNLSWPAFEDIINKSDWDNDVYLSSDWLNANWALLVGRVLLGKCGDLQPLNIGTREILKRKHRSWFQTADGRYTLVALGSRNKHFSISPPFDTVQVMDADGTILEKTWGSVAFKLEMREP